MIIEECVGVKMFLDLKTSDKDGGGFYQMASGLWPRFSHYEIRGKDGRQFICPGVDATLAKYDPWEAQNQFDLCRIDNNQVPISRETRPPYLHFLSLLDNLGIDYLDTHAMEKLLASKELQFTANQIKIVCDWCGRYGLLGMFFHEVKMFRLPYIERQPEGNIYKSIAYYKKQGKWGANDFRFKVKQQSQKAVTSSFLDWKSGRVELESQSSCSLFTGQEDSFDWSDPHWIAANYFPFADNIMETLTTGAWEDVWRGYCEPVDLFVGKAALLARSLRFLAQRDRIDRYENGVSTLSMLVGEAPVSYGLVRGKVTPTFRTPSLLSAYSLMALSDAADGAHVLQCENEQCRRWFTSMRTTAKFCIPKCNTAQQQRKSRQRYKEGQNTGEEVVTVCKGCGASMDGKRPQSKFCTTTCGNTFRKREQRARKAQRERFIFLTGVK